MQIANEKGAEFEKNSAPSLFALKSARGGVTWRNAVFRELFVDFRQLFTF